MKDKRVRYGLVAAVAVVVVLVAVFALRGGGLDNATPEGAAAVFVKAMVTHDRDLMDRINRSLPLEYPTSYLMQQATEQGWSEYDLSGFAYRHLGRGVVEVTFPDGKKRRMQTVEENGRWYFSRWD
jgi:hypothetical protein